ncbi:hypothetical protein [Cupriavidus sp. AcVe19-1a]|uniref:hypothetical protein n=1 Tax=Cupriavidus sp. AcVe19-1a TaxID=2821359 RepID=UPI001AE1377C|nr:hypothetical protein [Cupriavidus sp. AcVe19-1a]MBP0632387.1 hypothetical protein [Cupriavidus sp. AcVe19-1a]
MTKPVSPAALALRLHDRRTSALTLELEADEQVDPAVLSGCYRSEGRAFEFESLEARNILVAMERFDALDKNWNEMAGPLFEAAHDLWRKEIGHADYASGRLLALAEDHVDVVLAAARRIRAGMDVFAQLHVLQAALPHLNILDVSSLLDLCEAKHETTKNDMAGGLFHFALEQWLAQRPDTAKRLHELAVLSPVASHQSLVCNATVALSKSDFAAAVEMAIEDAKSERPEVAVTGIWTLGRLLVDSTDKSLTEKLEASIAGYLGAAEPSVRHQALHAACGAMHKSRVFDQDIMVMAQAGDQHALCGVAEALFRHWKLMREQVDLNVWLAVLALLDVEYRGGTTAADGVFSDLLEATGYEDAVADTLQAWVARRPPDWRDTAFAKTFPQTISALRGIPALWSRFLTTWILSESKAHPAAIVGLASDVSDEGGTIRFDTAVIDELDAEGLVFLARRMLGFFIDANVLLNLTYSLLGAKDASNRIYALARGLIVSEIGYDYPETTVKSLEQRTAETEGEEKAFLEDTLAELKSIIDAERALPRLKALQPSAQLRRYYARARAEQMRGMLREASKASILHMIANTITIKAGNGSFSHNGGGYGDVTTMGAISHSIELPRREVLDPIGNEIRMLRFRAATRGQQ